MSALSETQRRALEIAAGAPTGTIIPIGGGYWVAGETTRELRDNLREGREPRPPWVGTKTIYACADRGWLRGLGQFVRHHDPHRITDEGRAMLQVGEDGDSNA